LNEIGDSEREGLKPNSKCHILEAVFVIIDGYVTRVGSYQTRREDPTERAPGVRVDLLPISAAGPIFNGEWVDMVVRHTARTKQ
jgi:hypothetical protein